MKPLPLSKLHLSLMSEFRFTQKLSPFYPVCSWVFKNRQTCKYLGNEFLKHKCDFQVLTGRPSARAVGLRCVIS